MSDYWKCDHCGLRVVEFSDPDPKPPIKIGKLSIDLDEAQFKIGRAEVKLPNSQYHLLYELMRRPGRLVRNDSLLWAIAECNNKLPEDYPDDGYNILKVHMSQRRKKTGLTINAIWGRGYRLVL